MEKENNSMCLNQDVHYDCLKEFNAMKEEIANLRIENQIIKEQQNNQNAHILRLQNCISKIESKIVALTSANDLPNEIWLEIFKFLPHEDREQVRLVCKHFQSIIDSITKTTLKIDYENVAEIRARIETKYMDGLNSKRVRLLRLKRARDIKFILHSIGQQIEDLSIYETDIWDNFSGLVPNLKFLEIKFRTHSRSYMSHLAQWELPLLEKLILLNNYSFPSETNLLLTKISEQNSKIALKELKLECKSLCEQSVQNVLIRHANSLEILYIVFLNPCRIGWALTLSKMHKLKKIYWKGSFGNEFPRTILNAISKLSALEVIDISCHMGYNLSDPITWDLRELKKLRELKLHDCPLPNAQLKSQRPLMEILQVTNDENIEEMDLIRVISCFPNLRTLVLSIDATAMTNTILSNIFRYQTRLQCLAIYRRTNITDAGLIGTKDEPYPISRLKHLEQLDLRGFVNLTDQALSEFLFPRLRILNLDQSKRITSKGIEKLVTNCPRLQNLKISSDAIDNGNALFIIRNGLKQLNKLVLTNCNRKYYRNYFNNLKDPLTNKPFASKCELVCDY